MSITNFYEHKPQNGDPKHMVIMLHGLGSNGQDLISLAPILSSYVPDAVFISPDAPFTCDMVPAGYPNSYQWFSLQDRDPKKMLEGVKVAFPLIAEFIEDQAKRYEIDYENIALLGFSQGTMTALYTAMRLKQKVAGVLGYSGALIGDCSSKDLHKIPVCLIHGKSDDVVPVAAWEMAKESLISNGFDFSGHTTDYLTHSIDQAGIESGGEFLRSVFAAK